MKIKLTNNTSYDISLIDGTIINHYGNKIIETEDETLINQIRNLEKQNIIEVNIL